MAKCIDGIKCKNYFKLLQKLLMIHNSYYFTTFLGFSLYLLDLSVYEKRVKTQKDGYREDGLSGSNGAVSILVATRYENSAAQQHNNGLAFRYEITSQLIS